MIYSVLEQHKDGAWWYHPGYSYDTEEKAKQEADAFSKRFDNRPTMVFSHEVRLPQKHSTCTRDFKTFGFAGGVEWIAKQPGVPIRKYSNGWTAWYIDDHPNKEAMRDPDQDLYAYPEETIVVLHQYGPVVVFLETLEDLAVFENAQKLKIDEEISMAINITKQEAIDKIVAEFNLPDPSQEREVGKSFYAKDCENNADFFFDKRQYTRHEVIERLVNLFHGVNILEGQCSVDPITLLWTIARIEDRDKTNPDAA